MACTDELEALRALLGCILADGARAARYGDAAACVGVLLVFGMALVAVVCGRPGLRPPSPPRPRGRPPRQAAHLTCVSTR